MNLRQSLAPAPPVTFQVADDNSVARNTTNKVQYTFTLPPDTKLLRVTLVWTDPPGNALVNILSLRVQAPPFPAGGNRDFVGNRWQAAPNAQFSASVGAVPPPGGFETIHNVQQVVIPNPPTGQYLVEVRGGAFTNNQYQTFPGTAVRAGLRWQRARVEFHAAVDRPPAILLGAGTGRRGIP